MTRRMLAAITVAAASLAATPVLATERAVDGDGLVWSCGRTGAPSHREIAAAFGYENWWFARNLQPVLYLELRRACREHGTAVVQITPREAGIDRDAVTSPRRG